MAFTNTNAEISAIRLHVQGSKPAAPATNYVLIYQKADGLYIEDSGATETKLAIGGDRLGTTIFSIDGAATAAAGKLRIYNKSGVTRTINRVWISANTAPTGANFTVDVHKSGTTIFTTQSNRPVIAASAYYGDTTTIEVASWGDAEYLTMDVDVIGSTIAGSDITVGIEYTY